MFSLSHDYSIPKKTTFHHVFEHMTHTFPGYVKVNEFESFKLVESM